ncbi:MAG: hypothetical protein AAF098_11170 [Pseudomonadota bacterium]
MNRIKNLSLARSLPLIAAGCTLLVGLCVVWLAATSNAYLQKQRDRGFGEALASQIALGVSEPLQRGDLLGMRAMLDRFLGRTLARGVIIYDIEGSPMGAAGDTAKGALNRYRSPIRVGGDTAGEVVVFLDGRRQQETQWRLVSSLGALVAALSLLCFLSIRGLAAKGAKRLAAITDELRIEQASAQSSALEAPHTSSNELAKLEAVVADLPMKLLRTKASVPAPATDFQAKPLLFVHLASLDRYVATLSESNLHRYTRRLQQILQAAASCYGGSLAVVRPFGVLIGFRSDNAENPPLDAACCARLIALTAEGLEARTNLSLGFSMALSMCEISSEQEEDFYPELYVQSTLDEMREQCLAQNDLPALLISSLFLQEESIRSQLNLGKEISGGQFFQLASLQDTHEALLRVQSEKIVERIKPATT